MFWRFYYIRIYSRFEKAFMEQYPEIKLDVINAGVIGETSQDGLKRLP